MKTLFSLFLIASGTLVLASTSTQANDSLYKIEAHRRCMDLFAKNEGLSLDNAHKKCKSQSRVECKYKCNRLACRADARLKNRCKVHCLPASIKNCLDSS